MGECTPRLFNGVQKHIMKEGTGDSPKNSDEVHVYYTGRLHVDSCCKGKVFDSCTKGSPFKLFVNLYQRSF